MNINLIKQQEKLQKEYKMKEIEYQKQLKEFQKQIKASSDNNSENQPKFEIKGLEKYSGKNLNFRTFNSNLEIEFSELQIEK